MKGNMESLIKWKDYNTSFGKVEGVVKGLCNVYAVKMQGDRQANFEDLYSIAYTEIWQKAHKYISKWAFTTFVANIVRNKFEDERKAQCAAKRFSPNEVVYDDTINGATHHVDKMFDIIMWERITDEEKTIVILRYQGYTLADIAMKMNSSITAIHNKVKYLEQYLNDKGE